MEPICSFEEVMVLNSLQGEVMGEVGALTLHQRLSIAELPYTTRYFLNVTENNVNEGESDSMGVAGSL